MLLEVQHVKKVYKTGKTRTTALQDIDFGVQKGEFVAIMGESGSGKSSLLNIIATFDMPTEGKILLNQEDITTIKPNKLAKFRRDMIGFVFQDFNVLDQLSNRDNILLPLVLANHSVTEMQSRLSDIAPLLGIEKLLDKYPYEISGGQRQRVAIARAIISKPHLILSDEPTGALDSNSSQQILALFQDLNAIGHTLLMVTHSIKAASVAKRVLFIKDGVIFHELYRGDLTTLAFQERISHTLTLLAK